jgi:hypothetical protein
MKNLFLLLLLLAGMRMSAQVNSGGNAQIIFFDPEHDAVAIRNDTTLQLLVSEYILAKSVKARLGQDYQVRKIYKSRSSQGDDTLIFEGEFNLRIKQRFTLSIPMIPDTLGLLYYASTQALLCSQPGCNNCSIVNGSCAGCCSSGTASAIGLPAPLLKVPMTIEQ